MNTKERVENFSIHSEILTASKVAFFKFLQVGIQFPTKVFSKSSTFECKHLCKYNTVHKSDKGASGYVVSRKNKSVDTFLAVENCWPKFVLASSYINCNLHHWKIS